MCIRDSSSIAGSPSASLGGTVAASCTTVLDNTAPSDAGFETFISGFDGGGWHPVSSFTPNSDSTNTDDLNFDGLFWVARSPRSFSGVAASWTVSVSPSETANIPSLPRAYDLLLVITKGTFSNADSLGFLISDFTFAQLGQARGSFSATFPASDTSNNPVRTLALLARTQSAGTGPSAVPEPGALLLLLGIGVALLVVASRKAVRGSMQVMALNPKTALVNRSSGTYGRIRLASWASHRIESVSAILAK